MTYRSFLTCVAIATICFASLANAQSSGVDPKADTVLRAMTTYLGGLKQFSAQTENTLEVVTTDGQKIQYSSPVSVTVARPNKFFAERKGDIVDQAFYYDGKTLTLYNPGTKHYATVPAPANIDAMLEFAQTQLDVFAPAADLFDTRAYEKLMQDVKSGLHLGMVSVGGQRCHHLAYRAADVDWQVWVREGDKPLPCRYVITSKDIAGQPQFAVQIVKWDTAPKVAANRFTFVPPSGAKAVEFLPVGSGR